MPNITVTEYNQMKKAEQELEELKTARLALAAAGKIKDNLMLLFILKLQEHPDKLTNSEIEILRSAKRQVPGSYANWCFGNKIPDYTIRNDNLRNAVTEPEVKEQMAARREQLIDKYLGNKADLVK